MGYSDVSICNMALLRAGANNTITSIESPTTENERKIAAFYEIIRDEVLSEVKPKFATKRVALTKNSTAPVNGYDYAYILPTDFLCRVDDRKGRPALAPEGYYNGFANDGTAPMYYGGLYLPTFTSLNLSNWLPYEIERTSDNVLCICCDYDNTSAALYLAYVMKVTNPEWFTPMFVAALVDRLAAECSLSLTDASRFTGLIQKYELSKKAAKIEALSADSLTDETGSDSWERAGR